MQPLDPSDVPQVTNYADKIDSAASQPSPNFFQYTKPHANTMRQTYRPLSDAEKELMAKFKDVGQQFWDLCDQPALKTRELALAKTKIEEAVMWATKSITGPGVS